MEGTILGRIGLVATDDHRVAMRFPIAFYGIFIGGPIKMGTDQTPTRLHVSLRFLAPKKRLTSPLRFGN